MSLPQNKRFAARRLLCLLLALAFGLALAGCGSSASSEPAAQDQEQVLTDDALYELTAEKVDQPLDGAGAAIALAVGAEERISVPVRLYGTACRRFAAILIIPRSSLQRRIPAWMLPKQP